MCSIVLRYISPVLKRVTFQTISMVLPVTRRGAEDRSDDGIVRATVLPAKPGHLHQLGHVLRALFRHHHAEHIIAQPIGEGQANCRDLHLDEQGRDYKIIFSLDRFFEAPK